jgi:hypothetical protein
VDIQAPPYLWFLRRWKYGLWRRASYPIRPQSTDPYFPAQVSLYVGIINRHVTHFHWRWARLCVAVAPRPTPYRGPDKVRAGLRKRRLVQKSKQRKQQCHRDLMTPRMTARYCPPRNSTSRVSRVFQARCKLYSLFASTCYYFRRWIQAYSYRCDCTLRQFEFFLPCRGLLRYTQTQSGDHGSLNRGSTIRHVQSSCEHGKTFVFHERCGISWPAERLSASQGRLCSIKLLSSVCAEKFDQFQSEHSRC